MAAVAGGLGLGAFGGMPVSMPERFSTAVVFSVFAAHKKFRSDSIVVS